MHEVEELTKTHTMQDLVENITELFSRPVRKRYIDEDRGYVTREESEFRLFICNVGFNICLQIVLIVLVSIHFAYEVQEPKFTDAGIILWELCYHILCPVIKSICFFLQITIQMK